MTDVYQDIKDERDRQNEKWGVQHHNLGWWMTILGEEYGEACQDALSYNFGGKKRNKLEDFRTEMIQVAAVATAICEAIDENRIRVYDR